MIHNENHPEGDLPSNEDLKALLETPPAPWWLRPLSAYAERTVRLEKAYVTGSEADLRSIHRGLWVRGLLSLACWTATGFYMDLPAAITFVGAVTGATYATFVISRTVRASAYRSGWWDGRREMVSGLAEAQKRGMSMSEWLDAEFEKDLKIHW